MRQEDIKLHKNGKIKTKRNIMKTKPKKIQGRRKGSKINRVLVAEKQFNSLNKLGRWRGIMGDCFCI